MSNDMVTIDQLTEILNVIPSDTYALISENGVTKKVKLESLINKTLSEVQILEIEGVETNDKTLKGALVELSTQVKDIPYQFSTEQTESVYKIKYNNVVIATIPLGNGSVTPTPTTKYSITNNLSHATNSNSATSIEENSPYNATITANSNYRIKNVTVTMYGTDITDTVYSGGRISIDRVIGNIVITVTTELISGGDEDLSKLEGILQDRLLVWHDEFDDATLDTSKWRYATHNSGGSEQQAYTVGRTENVRLAGDFTNVANPILSNKQKLSQNNSLACMNNNGMSYIDASGAKLGGINLSTSEQNYNINGCIALRYNKTTLRVDTDTMEFTGSTINNKNTTLSSAFTQGSYPALLGNVATAKIYWKVVLVYNRVLTDAEIGTTMNAITTFLNA